jgi:hypothetical protein
VVELAGQVEDNPISFIRLTEHSGYRPSPRPRKARRVDGRSITSFRDSIRLSRPAAGGGRHQPVVLTDWPLVAPVRTFVVDPNTIASWACWFVPWCDPQQPPDLP